MTHESLIFAYLAAVLLAILGLYIFSETRRRRFRPSAKQDNIFRCGRCQSVYTDDPDVGLSKCPQCGQMNEPYQY